MLWNISENSFIMGNLNWLLHKMYLMGDFTFCKQLIELQMQTHYNQEYLFYMKVSYSFSCRWTYNYSCIKYHSFPFILINPLIIIFYFERGLYLETDKDNIMKHSSVLSEQLSLIQRMQIIIRRLERLCKFTQLFMTTCH